MSISKKEFDLMMEYFERLGQEVRTSKKAARALLASVGLLTTRGTPRKICRPARKSKP